jgi:putative DNA primase/helicase
MSNLKKTAAVGAMSVISENVPEELKKRDQWVGWVYAVRGEECTKVPINPGTGGNASTTVPETWSTFGRALSLAGGKIWHEGGHKVVEGVGFVLSAGDPYVGYDFDGVLDPETGEVEEWAIREVRRLASYTEVSPSGRGIRVIGRGKLPGKGGPHKTDSGHTLEIYDRERFLTLTGHKMTTTTKEPA